MVLLVVEMVYIMKICNMNVHVYYLFVVFYCHRILCQ